ncbi:hypothetical protein SARC_16196, partial [Sphaeroforma arctica JP610]
MSEAAVKSAVANIEQNGTNIHDKRTIAAQLKTVMGLRGSDGQPGKFTHPAEVAAMDK